MALCRRWHLKQMLIWIIAITILSMVLIYLDISRKPDMVLHWNSSVLEPTRILPDSKSQLQRMQVTLPAVKKVQHLVYEKQRGYGPTKDSVIKLFSNENIYLQQYCGRKVEIFNFVMASFRDIIVDPVKSQAKATGGTEPDQILHQNEADEEYRMSPGFFTLFCPETGKRLTTLDSEKIFAKGQAKHLKDYIKSLHIIDSNSTKDLQKDVSSTVDNRLTIALMRYEYANVYWSIMDIYDVYLTMRFFNATGVNDTQILLTDARPKGHLDGLWTVFGTVTRLQDVKNKVVFSRLVWRYGREYSPLLQKSAKTIPDLTGFREFVLGRLGISPQVQRNCDRLTVLYIWRRDYVAHPRNPSGLVWRKIRNEEELLRATLKAFPTFRVTGVQLDKLSISEQLKTVSSADIYIGMHGAGMTFSLFLPPKSAVIEFYPKYYQQTNWHMEMAAKWGGHRFFSWHNNDGKLEEEKLKYTTVPVDIPLDYIKKAKDYICG